MLCANRCVLSTILIQDGLPSLFFTGKLQIEHLMWNIQKSGVSIFDIFYIFWRNIMNSGKSMIDTEITQSTEFDSDSMTRIDSQYYSD
ncbi:hypothetical protein RHMOL_Rhmol01G0152700 [Rhododendron molle]|uniref:Uncharacterized protein n=1 Tax=Rhododendron molle TaxID=49168 RepID=A0ACC0Q338_RHOML|nr:hypothetical protein RHMOL_Rhmol01G0152700 [Rhododendron molle]